MFVLPKPRPLGRGPINGWSTAGQRHTTCPLTDVRGSVLDNLAEVKPTHSMRKFRAEQDWDSLPLLSSGFNFAMADKLSMPPET